MLSKCYPTCTFLQLSFKCFSFIKIEFDYLITILTNMYMYVIHIWHVRTHGNFCLGGPGPTARKQLWKGFLLLSFLVLNLFYSFTEGFQWLFQRKL